MEVKAVEKFIRISPKKARLVADLVRGKNAKEALVMLKFMPKKAARIIYKAVKSAVSNAENNAHLDVNNLVIKKITVDGGPTLKRYRPRSRGMASHILKRTSHITVIVADEDTSNDKKKSKAAVKDTKKNKVEKETVKKDSDKNKAEDDATEGSK